MLLLLLLRLCCFTCGCLLSVSAVAMETVVGVAGRSVTLPCRSEAMKQRGAAVCWGREEPTLFSCQHMLINAAAGHVTYRKSNRYSVSSSESGSSSLSISDSRLSDSGFYHCRVERPGLFNDQTFRLHLIIIISSSRSVTDSPATESSELSGEGDAETLNAPRTATSSSRGREREATGSDVTADGREREATGSDVTADDTTGPMVALVQSPVQQVNNLHIFIGHTLRLSLIIFIPALLLTAAYRVWRSNRRATTDRRLNQSEEEDSSV